MPKRTAPILIASLALAGCGSVEKIKTINARTASPTAHAQTAEPPTAAAALRRDGEEERARERARLEGVARRATGDGFTGHLYDIHDGIYVAALGTLYRVASPEAAEEEVAGENELGESIIKASRGNADEARGAPIEHLTALYRAGLKEPSAVIWFAMSASRHWRVLGWSIADEGFDVHYETTAEALRRGRAAIKRESREDREAKRSLQPAIPTPNVLEKGRAAAERVLRRADLKPLVLLRTVSETSQAGHVVRQYPAPGTDETAKSVITIYIGRLQQDTTSSTTSTYIESSQATTP